MIGNRPHVLVTLEDASDRLIDFFPELDIPFKREIDSARGETPGPYVTYEDTFFPYIERVLASGDNRAIQRVFDYLELLATAEDARLRDLTRIAILGPLTVEPERVAVARRYMRSTTRRLLRQARTT